MDFDPTTIHAGQSDAADSNQNHTGAKSPLLRRWLTKFRRRLSQTGELESWQATANSSPVDTTEFVRSCADARLFETLVGRNTRVRWRRANSLFETAVHSGINSRYRQDDHKLYKKLHQVTRRMWEWVSSVLFVLAKSDITAAQKNREHDVFWQTKVDKKSALVTGAGDLSADYAERGSSRKDIRDGFGSA